jgi:hypothetical protein
MYICRKQNISKQNKNDMQMQTKSKVQNLQMVVLLDK